MPTADARRSAQDVTTEALGLAVAARVPVLLWGAPGTGKTSAIRAMADAAGLPCETVIAAIREPSDFSGLPVVVGGVVHFAPPRWAERLAAAGHGVLFLDEISTAPPAVQAALLRVVLERVVGDLDLPEGVVVVAAANPPEQAADGWDLSAPLANRFCHLDWHVEPAAFAMGLAGGFPAPPVAALPSDWEDQLPLGRGLVSAFVSVRPALTVDVPADAARAGRAWPSPRTWELAARLWTAATAAEASADARAALVVGTVGDAAGLQFLTWLHEQDLPDPEDVLADPAAFSVPDRPDRTYALLAAVAAAVAANSTAERWAAGWKVLARVGETSPDVAAVAARTLARCRPPDATVPPEVKLFAPMLRDAGLLGT
jgi:MoxR-like ATPase